MCEHCNKETRDNTRAQRITAIEKAILEAYMDLFDNDKKKQEDEVSQTDSHIEERNNEVNALSVRNKALEKFVRVLWNYGECITDEMKECFLARLLDCETVEEVEEEFNDIKDDVKDLIDVDEEKCKDSERIIDSYLNATKEPTTDFSDRPITIDFTFYRDTPDTSHDGQESCDSDVAEEDSRTCVCSMDGGATIEDASETEWKWMGFCVGHPSDDVVVMVDKSARLAQVKTENNSTDAFKAEYRYNVELPENIDYDTLRKDVADGIIRLSAQLKKSNDKDLFFI